MLNKTKISKRIIIAKASPIFLTPKNAGVHARFTKNWVKNRT